MYRKILAALLLVVFPVFAVLHSFTALLLPGSFIPSFFIIAFSICCLILFYLTFRVIMQIIKEARDESEVMILQKNLELQIEQTEKFAELRETVQKKQNYLIQELTGLKQALHTDDKKMIQHHMDGLSDTFTRQYSEKCCSDSLLNAVLQNKKEVAKKYGIDVKYQVILPEQLMEIIPHTVLTCIFFNLMDNGIKSCRTSGKTSPYIRLNTGFHTNIFYIQMENSNADAPDSPTSEQYSPEHGHGLSIMEELADRYNGTCEWLDCGDTFKSIITLCYIGGHK